MLKFHLVKVWKFIISGKMECEICGSPIKGSPKYILVGGAKLAVCSKCARHGTIIRKEERVESYQRKPQRPTLPPLYVIARRTRRRPVIRENEEEYEIVEGYGEIIRKARESRGLSIEELASMVGEKASLISKIEREKIVPTISLAKKLEHLLQIKLISLQDEVYPKVESSKGKFTLTIADIVEFKNSKRSEK